MQKDSVREVLFIGKGGKGGVLADDKVLFFPYVIDGEKVLLSKDNEGYFVKEIVEASENRVNPKCPFFGECGGCNFQHIRYHYQLELKKRILLRNLKVIGKIEKDDVEVISSPEEFFYRAKIVFKGKDGKIGFFKRSSNELVEVDKCFIAESRINDFLKEFRGKIPYETEEIIALTNGSELSVYVRVGRRIKHFYGKKEVVFNYDGILFRVSALNFIQSNLFLHKKLLELLSSSISEEDDKVEVSELFSGAGFFTVLLLKKFKKLTIYEINEKNIKMLKKNLELNGIKNKYEILRRDLYSSDIRESEVFVVDPPRSGLSKRLIKVILSKRTRKVIYFSCDSATFSRDSKWLIEGGFSIKKLFLIDNFPQTDHFEIFSVFER